MPKELKQEHQECMLPSMAPQQQQKPQQPYRGRRQQHEPQQAMEHRDQQEAVAMEQDRQRQRKAAQPSKEPAQAAAICQVGPTPPPLQQQEQGALVLPPLSCASPPASRGPNQHSFHYRTLSRTPSLHRPRCYTS